MLQGHLVDFLWPELRLIVEVDGYGTHGNRAAFEADRSPGAFAHDDLIRPREINDRRQPVPSPPLPQLSWSGSPVG